MSSQAIAPEITEQMIEAAESIEDLYRRGTPDTWRKVYLAMWTAAPHDRPAQPDCRTCRHSVNTGYEPLHCVSTDDCTNGDKYQEAPKVVLWGTEP
jgi:hypothetical protein